MTESIVEWSDLSAGSVTFALRTRASVLIQTRNSGLLRFAVVHARIVPSTPLLCDWSVLGRVVDRFRRLGVRMLPLRRIGFGIFAFWRIGFGIFAFWRFGFGIFAFRSFGFRNFAFRRLRRWGQLACWFDQRTQSCSGCSLDAWNETNQKEINQQFTLKR